MKSRRRTHISVKPSSKFCFSLFHRFLFHSWNFFCLFNFFFIYILTTKEKESKKKAAYKDQFGKWFDKACIVSKIQEEEKGEFTLFIYSIDFCSVYFWMYFFYYKCKFVWLSDIHPHKYESMKEYKKINKSYE